MTFYAKFRTGWLLAALLAVSACAAYGEVPVVQRYSYYPGAVGKPVEQKVVPGTKEVQDRALKTNLDYGQDVRPDPAAADHPLVPKVRAALKGLPPAIHKLASQYVMAVYLLEDDWGTATTEGVQDSQGKWHYSYITLNLTELSRTANAWTEWKENSAFRPDPKYRLKMTIEPPEGDTVENAIRFIFLHELGHVLGLGLRVHASWDEEGLPSATRDSKFLGVTWRLNADKTDLESKWAASHPRLTGLKFYRFAKAPTPLADAETIYRALGQSDFPSLYGTINFYDDFAESFVIYVHTRMERRPYRVELFEGNTQRLTYTSCIVSNTCPEKVKALEAVLGVK